jgi:hypothetical protein
VVVAQDADHQQREDAEGDLGGHQPPDIVQRHLATPEIDARPAGGGNAVAQVRRGLDESGS